MHQCFVLFLGSEYDYNVHLRLRTVEQTCVSEQPVTILQGQTKKVSFQEFQALGQTSKISRFYRLDQLELTVTKTSECGGCITPQS